MFRCLGPASDPRAVKFGGARLSGDRVIVARNNRNRPVFVGALPVVEFDLSLVECRRPTVGRVAHLVDEVVVVDGRGSGKCGRRGVVREPSGLNLTDRGEPDPPVAIGEDVGGDLAEAFGLGQNGRDSSLVNVGLDRGRGRLPSRRVRASRRVNGERGPKHPVSVKIGHSGHWVGLSIGQRGRVSGDHCLVWFASNDDLDVGSRGALTSKQERL